MPAETAPPAEPAPNHPKPLTPAKPRLKHVPLGSFAMVMGLAGTAVAWRLAHQQWGVTPWIGRGIAILALAVFALAAAAYGAKAIR